MMLPKFDLSLRPSEKYSFILCALKILNKVHEETLGVEKVDLLVISNRQTDVVLPQRMAVT